MRTSLPPVGLEASVRHEIRAVDPTVPSSGIRTMEQMLAGALATRRFSLLLVDLFAATALFVAAAGLYAVIAYGVRNAPAKSAGALPSAPLTAACCA